MFVLLGRLFSGRGSQEERLTRAAHSASLGSALPGGRVTKPPLVEPCASALLPKQASMPTATAEAYLRIVSTVASEDRILSDLATSGSRRPLRRATRSVRRPRDPLGIKGQLYAIRAGRSSANFSQDGQAGGRLSSPNPASRCGAILSASTARVSEMLPQIREA